ncbi:MAG: hypothetical protein N6V49_13095 [Serratia symbiotica]|nr:hypothetical protein [Serratia symbiotica]
MSIEQIWRCQKTLKPMRSTINPAFTHISWPPLWLCGYVAN